MTSQEFPTSLQTRPQQSHLEQAHQSSGEGSEGDDEVLVPEQQGSPQGDAAPAEEAAYGKSSLTKSVLEAHFIYSLSEAARRLGVSNTTVKRACRYIHAEVNRRRNSGEVGLGDGVYKC